MFAPFGRWLWHGPRDQRAFALSFDDGPSESTPQLLVLLAKYGAKATFFQCGMNVRSHPEIACAVALAGHEIGNHTDSHKVLIPHSKAFQRDQLRRAQESITEVTGVRPKVFRPPHGAYWFGTESVLAELGLRGVMWAVIGQDWKHPAERVADIVRRRVSNGAIICLHDGRGIHPNPDIRNTIEAVRRLLPELREEGFRFDTVSQFVAI